MKAHLRSARIAPKKANLIAKMVRGMPAHKAMEALERTHKKGARMIEELIKSALANASHNDKQNPSHLVIKTIFVNQGTSYRRAIPKARGSVRPIRKFLSHITVTLGIAEDMMPKTPTTPKSTKKVQKDASQKPKNTVKKTSSSQESSGAPVSSSDSSVSSDSSDSSTSSPSA